MSLFSRRRKAIGLKKRYTKKEIKEGGRLKAAVLLTDEERKTFSRAERLKRFKKWMDEQG
jgi:hypothetical protein